MASPARSKADENLEKEDRSDLLSAVHAGLAEVLPGIEILDRELEFDGGARVDLAGVDSGGALVVVVVVQGESGASALAILDALAYAQANVGLIGRHLDTQAIHSEMDPRMIVIMPALDEGLLVRLSPLFGAGVEVFGVRSVRSSRGERSYLVPLGGVAQGGQEARAFPEQVFVETLAEPLREVGGTLARRMAQLDDELEVHSTKSSLVWSFHGDVLARAERIGDRLQASVAPHHDPTPLGEVSDVDRFVERALSRLVTHIEPVPERRSDRPPIHGTESPLEVLTAEEIEAFRG